MARSDEPDKLAAPYRKFNLDALLDAAVKNAGSGAKSCKDNCSQSTFADGPRLQNLIAN